MKSSTPSKNSKVIVRHDSHMMSIILNRPHLINSIDFEMIRLIQKALDEAEVSEQIRLVLLHGSGEKGFCAGGDIKAMAEALKQHTINKMLQFFEEEYALDLRIHCFPKSVIVLADGITMGGGLGLAAGADIVVATERSRMAMPETRIGFFPDVGATGWMFTKCPKGYPEFLGLTGYEMVGAECVRLGFASHLVSWKNLQKVVRILEKHSDKLSAEKSEAVPQLHSVFASLKKDAIPQNPEMDKWVSTYFSGKTSLTEILASLSKCSVQNKICEGVFQRLSERSPTALVLTLYLLRHNEGRPLEDVFRADVRSVRYIMEHPDLLEGVRARLLDKDDNPRWQPNTIEKVKPIEMDF